MPRINLNNLSIKALMDMEYDDLLSLSRKGLNKAEMSEAAYSKAVRKNLAEITSRFTSVANRRIKALGKTKIGKVSPAYMRAKQMSKTGLFSVKGKDWNGLLNTMKEAKQFIESKTSTVKGWADVRSNVEKSIGADYFNAAYKSSKFWEAYRRLYEAHGGTIARKGSRKKNALTSERVQELLYNTITEKRDESGKRVVDWRSSIDRIINEADEDFSREYNKVKGRKQDVGSSRFVLPDED